VSRSSLPSVTAAILFSAATLLAQAPAPVFEVASIKPSEPITQTMIASGKLHVGMKVDGKRVDIGGFPLLQLICKAYDVKTYQVSGPAWLKAVSITMQRFDIVANLPEGATKEQVPQMLQTLLAERFKLVAHRESKDQPVYAMVIGKGGLKIKESAPPVAASADGAANPAITGSSSVSVSQGKGGAVVSDGTGKSQKMSPSADGKSMRFEISGATLSELAEGLTPLVDRPIIDMTGLTGKYELALDISMQELMNLARAQGANVPGGEGDASKPADLASDPGGSSLFTALQALGLKLEPRKSPMALIVVESVEKMPTEN
jgi:uncharacterized protein (TIGR03435 family)